MKVLVTGSKGQLGRSIQDLHPADFIYTDIEELDITDIQAIRALVAREKVEAIVNCAAYTNVEAAEDNYELAELLNAKAVENLATVMKEVGGLLVHISTDYVFGKEPYNTPCREDQKGTPTGVYGLTKLHGEEAILRSGVRYVTTDLLLQFNRMETAKRVEITALALGDLVVIAKDANGKYWYLGKDEPVNASAGDGQTGTARSDANRYTITLQDNSKEMPFEVDPSIVDALVA